MSPDEQKIIGRVLRAEFQKIRAKNPAYSQRAFAKKIKVNSGTLSSIFLGKRKLSLKSSREILSRLSLEENYRNWLARGVKIERAQLELDRFEIIAEPIHLNALNLLRVAGAEPTVAWLAKRLKKGPSEITEVVERLERAGLLRFEGRKLIPTRASIKTPENFPHRAVRAFHKSTLAEASEKLESVPAALRDFSSITIPGDPAKLEEVRALIKNFRDQVGFLLGSEPGSEVYKLSVQFYPVASAKEDGPHD